MYASLVLLMVTKVFALSAALDQEPKWTSDYGYAYEKVWTEDKPLAVFIGNGERGWEGLSKEGNLKKPVKELLKKHYVCVYVDATSGKGAKLASSFKIRKGLVISSHGGQYVAFSHEGELSNDDLADKLRRHSAPPAAPQPIRPVSYSSGSC